MVKRRITRETERRLCEVFRGEMRKIAGIGDKERAHVEADEAVVNFLKALGHTKEALIYKSVGKWYA